MNNTAKEKSKIYLVEDDPNIAQLVTFKLQKEGYEILHFSNGEGVVEAIKKEKPALVLSDVMMPIKNGITLLKEIKAIPEFAELPFILLTTLGHEDAILSGLEAGASDYITKPFSTAELLMRLKKALR